MGVRNAYYVCDRQSDCDEGWGRDEEMKKNEVRKEGKRGL